MALGAFNKSLMLQIQLANRLQQGHVAVVFVGYGSGGVSATLRYEGALYNHISPTMMQPNIEMLNGIQQHFQLLAPENANKKRYLDFLREDTSLNFLTF